MAKVKSVNGATRSANAASSSLSSFGLPGKGALPLQTCKTMAEAVRAAKRARRAELPLIPIGEGTNCAFLEPVIPAVFLRSTDRSLTIQKGTAGAKGSKMWLEAGAGLPWDKLVHFAVERGWSGVESLSGIPGTCGAAPVQNIGAYGASLADTLESVDALDLKTLQRVRLSRDECGFGYRTSIFNGAERGRFFITSIRLRLRAGLHSVHSLTEVRKTTLQTRRKKLPDYKKIPNCGSFFKNPIVASSAAKKFMQKNPGAPHWPEPDHKTKLSAGWLIENSGVRGKHWGKIAISPQHALILINEGETEHRHLKHAIADIMATVKNKFKVALEPEPNLFNKAFANKLSEKQT